MPVQLAEGRRDAISGAMKPLIVGWVSAQRVTQQSLSNEVILLGYALRTNPAYIHRNARLNY